MTTRSIRDVDVAGKRVLVRVDFNVPIEHGVISDDTRIRAAIPTITLLTDNGAKVILCSHLGRPKGKVAEDLRLAPIADRLSELIGKPVSISTDVIGPVSQAKAHALVDGEILLLENVRFEPGEEKNDPELAKHLAELADVYVNDAFGTAHRAHASTAGVADYLPSYAGLLIDREISALQRLLDHPDRPFVTILGGAKVSDKLAVIENLIPKVDFLLIGGGMANTFLRAQGHEIGKSLVEPDFVDKARALLEDAARRNVEIAIPVDVVVSDSINGIGTTVASEGVAPEQAIFDIGPVTAKLFADRIASARTIFWNGPMGVFEKEPFSKGTRAVAVAVGSSDAFSVVGGGDSVAAIEQMGVADKISHISTGGGASLEFVEGRELPGIAVLEKSA